MWQGNCRQTGLPRTKARKRPSSTTGRSKTRIFCCGVSPSSGSSPPPMGSVEFPPAHSRRPAMHTADFLSGRKRCWNAWRGPSKNGRLVDFPQSSASRPEFCEPLEYRSVGARWTRTLLIAMHGRHRESPFRRRNRLGRTSPLKPNGDSSSTDGAPRPGRQSVRSNEVAVAQALAAHAFDDPAHLVDGVVLAVVVTALKLGDIAAKMLR